MRITSVKIAQINVNANHRVVAKGGIRCFLNPKQCIPLHLPPHASPTIFIFSGQLDYRGIQIHIKALQKKVIPNKPIIRIMARSSGINFALPLGHSKFGSSSSLLVHLRAHHLHECQLG
jgi:hypothetical protein